MKNTLLASLLLTVTFGANAGEASSNLGATIRNLTAQGPVVTSCQNLRGNAMAALKDVRALEAQGKNDEAGQLADQVVSGIYECTNVKITDARGALAKKSQMVGYAYSASAVHE